MTLVVVLRICSSVYPPARSCWIVGLGLGLFLPLGSTGSPVRVSCLNVSLTSISSALFSAASLWTSVVASDARVLSSASVVSPDISILDNFDSRRLISSL